jgi:hypothetical protein
MQGATYNEAFKKIHFNKQLIFGAVGILRSSATIRPFRGSVPAFAEATAGTEPSRHGSQ